MSFPFNWFPLREGSSHTQRKMTSFPLFPFNWFPLREGSWKAKLVTGKLRRFLGFHSIGFPCERGVSKSLWLHAQDAEEGSFHSIGFPCERGVNTITDFINSDYDPGFHSIGFPCERGAWLSTRLSTSHTVSIQLVSPARGEC